MRFERDEEHYKPLVDANGMHYDEMAEGTINFGDVARHLLKQQAQYASRYIEGKHGSPKLGKGLRFSDLESDYHSIGIHPDDIEEFIRRYESYRGYSTGYVSSPEGDVVELDEAALEILHNYLKDIGAFEE